MVKTSKDLTKQEHLKKQVNVKDVEEVCTFMT